VGRGQLREDTRFVASNNHTSGHQQRQPSHLRGHRQRQVQGSACHTIAPEAPVSHSGPTGKSDNGLLTWMVMATRGAMRTKELAVQFFHQKE